MLKKSFTDMNNNSTKLAIIMFTKSYLKYLAWKVKVSHNVCINKNVVQTFIKVISLKTLLN